MAVGIWGRGSFPFWVDSPEVDGLAEEEEKVKRKKGKGLERKQEMIREACLKYDNPPKQGNGRVAKETNSTLSLRHRQKKKTEQQPQNTGFVYVMPRIVCLWDAFRMILWEGSRGKAIGIW